MLTAVLRFASLLLTGLLVGAMFGIWLGFNPMHLSASAYVEMQQNAIRALNVSMPMLGLVCIVLTGVLTFRTRGEQRVLLIAATVCLAAAGLITRFGNQPINAIVMSWSAHSPPANWADLRDLWWRWHIARTALGVLAFALSLLATTMHLAGSDAPAGRSHD